MAFTVKDITNKPQVKAVQYLEDNSTTVLELPRDLPEVLKASTWGNHPQCTITVDNIGARTFSVAAYSWPGNVKAYEVTGVASGSTVNVGPQFSLNGSTEGPRFSPARIEVTLSGTGTGGTLTAQYE